MKSAVHSIIISHSVPHLGYACASDDMFRSIDALVVVHVRDTRSNMLPLRSPCTTLAFYCNRRHQSQCCNCVSEHVHTHPAPDCLPDCLQHMSVISVIRHVSKISKISGMSLQINGHQTLANSRPHESCVIVFESHVVGSRVDPTCDVRT